ncbi:BTAD domain-containing putative transcriptional regulator [Saccharothrix yanglingensis]|uniref:SARP family transcriptional regulator n=1 Tax=Saccharothrix yanglingensis TaxID=659496 RepID=A0ABU0WX25_9PSEU|nr:BTAD domain-containing putative transcriptional regulator [Saccharothrix yanglingensis]MDQ2584411.1 SARP family transcriptional regulator [Saccharothrix yanglingensis]
MSATAPVTAALLGPARAWRDGTEVDLGTARRRAVFAVLALRADQVVSRDELVDAVWGDAPPTTAAASLHTYVSGLRRVLEPTRSKRSASRVLVSAGSGYSLKLAEDGLDVHRFERHRERAAALGAHDPSAALAELDLARSLWRGDALSGVPGPFAEAQRTRLRELRLAVVERRAELALVLGRHADVVADLAVLVDEHPLREGLRALLITALHRGGRSGEALEAFQDARRVLVERLGIEPGAALREAHQRVLADEGAGARGALPAPGPDAVGGGPAIRGPAVRTTGGTGLPGGGLPGGGLLDPGSPVRSPRHVDPDPAMPAAGVFVGRDLELGVLRRALADAAGGRGRSVWVEGEPGIGRSALLATGLAGAPDAGFRVAWGAGDEVAPRTPLRVVLQALGVAETSPDPRRAELARALRAPAVGDPVPVVVDRLLALVNELCAEAPLAVVVDDLQWADEASVLMWHRMLRVAHRLPLLLVAAVRSVPRRADVEQVRRAVVASGGQVVRLRPLSAEAGTALLANLVGAVPGESLRPVVECAGGNPLYTRDMVEALVRDEAIEVRDGVAETGAPLDDDPPRSLVSAVARRLAFLSPGTTEVLRSAALLGTEFALGDAATALGRPSSELIAAVEEATAAGLLDDAGPKLAFRHAVIREALYHGTPAAVRTALHRRVAQALATAGAPVELVVEQLAAAPGAVDPWAVDWLVDRGTALGRRAPDTAVRLLRAVVGGPALAAEHRERLAALLARLVFWLGRGPEAEARYVLARTRDPNRAAEMRWILAHVGYRGGRAAEAVDALRAASADPAVPPAWRARLEALLAAVLREGLDDVAAAEEVAHRAVRRGGEAGDEFAVAHALQALWQVDSVRRDHAGALARVERALAVIGGRPDFTELRLGLLDNKAFSLQNLDRLAEADEVLAAAREPVGGTASRDVRVTTAVQDYWSGRWDAAAEEGARALVSDAGTSFGLREHGPALLVHGVAALVAARRDRVDVAEAHLLAAAAHPLVTPSDREHADFLPAARAVLAERAGRPDEALAVLEPVLSTTARMVLRHQWLPLLTRLAVDRGRREPAARALAVAEEEAAAEREPARAAAALAWCRGLVEGDPAPVLEAAARFRAVGRPVELAGALEDAAVLSGSASVLAEAVRGYRAVGAVHDVRRADARWRAATTGTGPAEGTTWAG